MTFSPKKGAKYRGNRLKFALMTFFCFLISRGGGPRPPPPLDTRLHQAHDFQGLLQVHVHPTYHHPMNGIAATGDFNQYKSDLKSCDLTLSGPSYNY